MFKDEITKLNPINKKELSIYFLVCVSIMFLAYFLDNAIVVSLGMVPSYFIYLYSKELNINSIDTPKLRYLVIGVIIFLYVGATCLAMYRAA